jgi:hypothetical protein
MAKKPALFLQRLGLGVCIAAVHIGGHGVIGLFIGPIFLAIA